MTVKAVCSQCGRSLRARACGPTHAIRYMEHLEQSSDRLTTRALARQREQCITERIRTSPSGTPEQTCREAYPDDRDHPTRWCVGCQLAAALDEDRRS